MPNLKIAASAEAVSDKTVRAMLFPQMTTLHRCRYCERTLYGGGGVCDSPNCIEASRRFVTITTIERWKEYVQDEIDNIGCWRELADSEEPDDRCELLRSWSDAFGEKEAANGFYSETAYIVQELTGRLPNLSVDPIHAIYAAICAWHHDRSAHNIPPQPVLVHGLLDRAIIAVNVLLEMAAAEFGLFSRRAAHDNVESGEPQGEEAARAGDRCERLSFFHKAYQDRIQKAADRGDIDFHMTPTWRRIDGKSPRRFRLYSVRDVRSRFGDAATPQLITPG